MKDLFDLKSSTLDVAGLLSLVGILTQVLPVIAGVLTVIWAWYRIKEIRLAIKIKQKELEE
jgi:hypothetical protein